MAVDSKLCIHVASYVSYGYLAFMIHCIADRAQIDHFNEIIIIHPNG